MPQHTEAVSCKAPRERKITYREFLRWDGENQHVEWIRGLVVPMPPVGNLHQDLGGWLLTALRLYVDERRLGVVRYRPFQMKTGRNLPGRAPDILFASKRGVAQLKKDHLQGPADLVVEIISPESTAVDRGEKYSEYEEGGVKEYWIIDPQRKQADFYRLGRDRSFHRVGLDEGIFRSAVLKGIWLDTSWLWKKPFPSTLKVRREWGVK